MSALDELTDALVDAAGSDAPDRLYVGRRSPAGTIGLGRCVVLIRDAAGNYRPLTLHERHSESWEWGYCGSGPAQLAFDLLWDHLECEPPAALYQDLKFDVVAVFPRDGWQLGTGQLAAWLGRRLASGEARR